MPQGGTGRSESQADSLASSPGDHLGSLSGMPNEMILSIASFLSSLGDYPSFARINRQCGKVMMDPTTIWRPSNLSEQQFHKLKTFQDTGEWDGGILTPSSRARMVTLPSSVTGIDEVENLAATRYQNAMNEGDDLLSEQWRGLAGLRNEAFSAMSAVLPHLQHFILSTGYRDPITEEWIPDRLSVEPDGKNIVHHENILCGAERPKLNGWRCGYSERVGYDRLVLPKQDFAVLSLDFGGPMSRGETAGLARWTSTFQRQVLEDLTRHRPAGALQRSPTFRIDMSRLEYVTIPSFDYRATIKDISAVLRSDGPESPTATLTLIRRLASDQAPTFEEAWNSLRHCKTSLEAWRSVRLEVSGLDIPSGLKHLTVPRTLHSIVCYRQGDFVFSERLYLPIEQAHPSPSTDCDISTSSVCRVYTCD